ncbi:MAG: hypothetical protein MJK14_12655, partial [Rivularia sp. ALOHA_DT_140]|nr:hypothetical protein [Rivularia sp. ALOHA_DT_140]
QPLPLTIAIIVITKQMLSFNFFGIIYFLEVPKAFLEQSGQNILGLVVNGVILKNESDSYFHFRNSYYSSDNNLANKNESKKQVDISYLKSGSRK